MADREAKTGGRTLPAIIAALEGVRPLIEASAARADRDRRFPDDVIDAIADAGLFRLWIPAKYEGDELPVPEALEVFEAACRIDGGAGWLVTIGIGGGLFGAHMTPEAAREVFLPQRALIAGSGSPTGEAAAVEGGYRVSGSWRYASGAHRATWFTANCVLLDGQERSDAPTVRAMAFRPEDVEVLDTWDVIGMRATGSHNWRVPDAFVPSHRVFDVFGEPIEGGPLYRFPFGGIAQLSFAAVALGVALQALDVFGLEVPNHRLQRAHAKDALVRAERRLSEAREAFHGAAQHAWEQVARGDELNEGDQQRIRHAAVEATRTSAAVVESLYLEAGMAPLFADSRLGRCWRDVHTVSQHIALAKD